MLMKKNIFYNGIRYKRIYFGTTNTSCCELCAFRNRSKISRSYFCTFFNSRYSESMCGIRLRFFLGEWNFNIRDIHYRYAVSIASKNFISLINEVK